MRSAAILLVLLAGPLAAQDATVPGEVSTPHPTIVHLSIVWRIEGDDDADGVVRVRFRARGEDAWREGLPLVRVPAGRSRDTVPIRRWPDQHAGSLFGLRPDTEYEIELDLDDPDGGSTRRTATARTRPVPRVPPDLPEERATPSTLRPLLAAGGAGRVIRLEPGEYGELEVPAGGEPGRPLVLTAEGDAVFARVGLRGRSHVHLEGLLVRGSIDLRGASDCVVRRCRVEPGTRPYGIGATAAPGATRCYVADNVVVGPNRWIPEAMGAEGENFGEGIQMTGPGNVICYNRVVGFRDGISFMEETNATEQVSIDVYGNDLDVSMDDAIEADFAMGNCRIAGNRITNAFVGLSSQPGLGGPTYFVRNAMYNLTHGSFKLHRYSRGDVVLHNTVVKIGDGMSCFTWETFDRAFFRNNLALGGTPGDLEYGGYHPGEGRAATMARPGPNSSFDHDALGAHGVPFAARFGDLRVESFEDLVKGPHERHAVQIGLDVFDGVPFPLPAVPAREPPDLRPRPGSAVVDRALLLPNVNDDFAGAAPDIGAYEAGRPLPHYGPRPPGVDEGTSHDGK